MYALTCACIHECVHWYLNENVRWYDHVQKCIHWHIQWYTAACIYWYSNDIPLIYWWIYPFIYRLIHPLICADIYEHMNWNPDWCINAYNHRLLNGLMHWCVYILMNVSIDVSMDTCTDMCIYSETYALMYPLEYWWSSPLILMQPEGDLAGRTPSQTDTQSVCHSATHNQKSLVETIKLGRAVTQNKTKLGETPKTNKPNKSKFDRLVYTIHLPTTTETSVSNFVFFCLFVLFVFS